ncbi:MAG: hypothetical protein KDK23_05730 [Leptospiraceae bacterium]|nr:hypothetical protein [Leptospiraceae bacterium]
MSFGLFEVLGIELEHMIVDLESLAIRPAAGEVLRDENDEIVDELFFSGTSWSNELVSHVIETKTDPPVKTVAEASNLLRRDLRNVLDRLEGKGLSLLGTGMHPFMNPREMVLWPGENGPIYRTFHRIFDCTGHGWANLQSMHLNLPFRDAEEFRRLMAAIRMLLPIMPALSASSPICESIWTGYQDYRLEVYRNNAARIPSVAGQIVPEPVYDPSEFEERILGRIYADMEDYDPDGILRYEWVNGRGAIPRFDRNAIEIRVLDTQESLEMDMAIALMIFHALKALVEETWSDGWTQSTVEQDYLVQIFGRVCRSGGDAEIEGALPALLGLSNKPWKALDIWRALAEKLALPSEEGLDRSLEFLLKAGCLSDRIKATLERKEGRLFPDGISQKLNGVSSIYKKFGNPLGSPFAS